MPHPSHPQFYHSKSENLCNILKRGTLLEPRTTPKSGGPPLVAWPDVFMCVVTLASYQFNTHLSVTE